MGSPVQCGGDSRADARLVNTRTEHQQPPANTIIMYSKLITSTATLVLLLCLVETGSGLKCHICNSYDSYHCGDPFYYPDNPMVPKTNKFLQDCPTDQEYTFCRKIYQKVRGDVRIIRGCGYIPDEKNRTCYTTVLEEYNTEVCSCEVDGCNSASMYQLSAAVVSAVCLAFLLH